MQYRARNGKLKGGLEPLTANGYIVYTLPPIDHQIFQDEVEDIMINGTGVPAENAGYGPPFSETVNSLEFEGVSDGLVNVVKEHAERLLGFPLKHTFTNGPRKYLSGTKMKLHVDHLRAMDMMIGVSVVVSATGAHPTKFPFDIIDNHGELQSLKLNIGDMVVYEAWSREHGRLNPLEEDSSYTIVMFHFIPMGEYEDYPFHRLVNKSR